MTNIEKVRYRVILETGYTVETSAYRTYGLQAEEKENGRWCCRGTIHDVAINKKRAMEMARTFKRGQLSVVHFWEAVKDGLDTVYLAV